MLAVVSQHYYLLPDDGFKVLETAHDALVTKTSTLFNTGETVTGCARLSVKATI